MSSSSRSSRSSPERNFRELVRSQRRLLLSEHRRLRRCNGSCRGKRGLCWPGDDRRREQRALAILLAKSHVSSAGRTMTGLACSFPSSSDAPVCVAGTGCLRKIQSSHARPCGRPSHDDVLRETGQNHPCSRHWPSARCLRKQEPYWCDASACCRCPSHTSHPPHPRRVQPCCRAVTNVQLSSMPPVGVSSGLAQTELCRYLLLQKSSNLDACRMGASSRSRMLREGLPHACSPCLSQGAQGPNSVTTQPFAVQNRIFGVLHGSGTSIFTHIRSIRFGRTIPAAPFKASATAAL